MHFWVHTAVQGRDTACAKALLHFLQCAPARIAHGQIKIAQATRSDIVQGLSCFNGIERDGSVQIIKNTQR